MLIGLMLLVLVGSFLFLAGLVRFSENVIRPAPVPPARRSTAVKDRSKSPVAS